MKIVILSALCFLFLFPAVAQVVGRGEKLIGGSISANFSNTNHNSGDQRNSNAGFFPALSFGIDNNLVFGVRGSINYQRNKNFSGNGQSYSQNAFSTGIGLYVKKYRPLQNRFGFYFDHGVSGYHFNQTLVSYPDLITSSSSTWGLGYQFSPGVFYQFSERFLGEGNIGGLYANYNDAPNEAYLFSLGASFLQHFNLGINYRFGKKKSSEN